MIIIGLLIAVLASLYFGFFHFLPDYFWFDSFNYTHVYIKTFIYKFSVFGLAFIPIFLIYLINQKALDHVLKRAQLANDEIPSSPLILKLRHLIQTFFGAYESAKLSISTTIKTIIYAGISLLIAKVFGLLA